MINNNQWAISVPRGAQTAAGTLAQKAIAAGLPAEQVDGNDAVAMHVAMTDAVERARTGGGARVIEALTYRLSDHTTADDATRYRPEEEVSDSWKRDPVVRLRTWLGANGWWSKDDEEAMVEEIRDRIETARTAVEKMPAQSATDLVDDLYGKLPEPLSGDREMLMERGHD